MTDSSKFGVFNVSISLARTFIPSTDNGLLLSSPIQIRRDGSLKGRARASIAGLAAAVLLLKLRIFIQ